MNEMSTVTDYQCWICSRNDYIVGVAGSGSVGRMVSFNHMSYSHAKPKNRGKVNR